MQAAIADLHRPKSWPLLFYLVRSSKNNSVNFCYAQYMHGSYEQDAKQQQVDYLYFLRTTILILIKLRDDAVLKRRWFSD
ncbi:hypothetical protein DIU31_003975 [Mucilaginibacter rubeus]|uniref:Uncharacterized protein n=1 Tax=Mucilaginibacter rubeus TaxID=2027860 RepID=A0AAE6JBQ6_9SPHI|nr:MULTISPECIES: hypothetical protein [Mucilaginibacter]QEM02712.1 hypothetical protein DIU31_003975 [Mucilaginibacter rubeus]QEM15331.1 hypothetical protein DIU38_004020 [Mucilaginibacter gossypii]QTE41939.1 hypothetical protein J3L19_23780 [Mucilaginibacter rubeus]QTE48542.1 hypothetical protein J3L21_23760 [Mucilaginibacter rubeus]QTE60607.1 hypothetical protein J3L22_18445 [Mucilaginibacter rubeus]